LNAGTFAGGLMAKRSEQRPQSTTRAIVAALVSAKAIDTDERIRVLTAALAALSVEVVGTVVQRRGVSRSKSPGGSKRLETPLNSATVIGPGKVEELVQLVRERGANVVYFLNELSAAQSQRLGAHTGCRVIPCVNESKPPVPNPGGC